MNIVDRLAEAALNGDALALRALAQEIIAYSEPLTQLPPPEYRDAWHRSVAAALVDLLAERSGQPGPGWTESVPIAPGTRHLLAAAATLPRLRRLCEEASPLPLRRRGLFAPPNYLSMA